MKKTGTPPMSTGRKQCRLSEKRRRSDLHNRDRKAEGFGFDHKDSRGLGRCIRVARAIYSSAPRWRRSWNAGDHENADRTAIRRAGKRQTQADDHFQQRRCNGLTVESADQYNIPSWVLTLVILLAGIASVGVMTVLIRNIMMPVQKLLGISSKVAAGNLREKGSV